MPLDCVGPAGNYFVNLVARYLHHFERQGIRRDISLVVEFNPLYLSYLFIWPLKDVDRFCGPSAKGHQTDSQ